MVNTQERRQRLIGLAEQLNARGWSSQIITPSGQTLLRVIDPEGVALVPEHVVCEGGRDDIDWYRWRQTRDHIAPADQPEAAAKEVIQELIPKGKP